MRTVPQSPAVDVFAASAGAQQCVELLRSPKPDALSKLWSRLSPDHRIHALILCGHSPLFCTLEWDDDDFPQAIKNDIASGLAASVYVLSGLS